MNKITITVEGTTGSGKTAICQLIAEALAREALPIVELPPVLSQSTNFSELRDVLSLEHAIRGIRGQVRITIVEKNLPRT